ncbi:MAG: inositol phosphorylceramide synthase [Candidatus Thermoplasmatota archaeon]|nr:inositol phosphorylceramide synthase [Candidatus Thermoplasmatota archaeon]
MGVSIIALLNLLLFLLALAVVVPKKIWHTSWSEYQTRVLSFRWYLALIAGVVLLHLLEVNTIDPYTTQLIGTDFAATIHTLENGVVYWFSQHWTPVLVYFFVFIYLILYPFILWFSLLYFLITNEKNAMKTYAFGLLLVYAAALPFYLFLPITNVYTYYGVTSALNTALPGVESFFYATTTTNNCFPSLHVAMALLVVYAVSQTTNKKFLYLAYFSACCVIGSVIYLAIHWIADVIGGVLLFGAVYYLLKRYTKEI